VNDKAGTENSKIPKRTVRKRRNRERTRKKSNTTRYSIPSRNGDQTGTYCPDLMTRDGGRTYRTFVAGRQSSASPRKMPGRKTTPIKTAARKTPIIFGDCYRFRLVADTQEPREEKKGKIERWGQNIQNTGRNSTTKKSAQHRFNEQHITLFARTLNRCWYPIPIIFFGICASIDAFMLPQLMDCIDSVLNKGSESVLKPHEDDDVPAAPVSPPASAAFVSSYHCPNPDDIVPARRLVVAVVGSQ